MWVIGILVVLAAVVLIYLWWWTATRRTKLSSTTKRAVNKQLVSISNLDDPALQILECDKVLDQILGSLGYGGTLGEKLKSAGPRLQNTNDLWWMHKLRNRIAHETGFGASSDQAKRSVAIVSRLLKTLR